eukprot:SAG31_NODE_3913_length_3756_cov_1.959256_7_plen_144_part_00
MFADFNAMRFRASANIVTSTPLASFLGRTIFIINCPHWSYRRFGRTTVHRWLNCVTKFRTSSPISVFVGSHSRRAPLGSTRYERTHYAGLIVVTYVYLHWFKLRLIMQTIVQLCTTRTLPTSCCRQQIAMTLTAMACLTIFRR